MLKLISATGKIMNSVVYALSDGIRHDIILRTWGDFNAARNLLSKDTDVRVVLITHGHHDPIFGLNKLKEVYLDCVVNASEECARMLVSAKLNLSMYLEMPMEYTGEVSTLHDGDNMPLFDGIYLTAIATPGHNPSCLCFEVENYLFTSDSYIPSIKVMTNLPRGNKKQAQNHWIRF